MKILSGFGTLNRLKKYPATVNGENVCRPWLLSGNYKNAERAATQDLRILRVVKSRKCGEMVKKRTCKFPGGCDLELCSQTSVFCGRLV